jgi:TetR/AcrR family transcriptional repressor of nem operon
MRTREAWLGGLEAVPEEQRAKLVLKRYLNSRHRDCPATGCPLPAVSAETRRGPAALQAVLAEELETSLQVLARTMAEDDDQPSEAVRQQAIAVVALCVGGLLLGRGVGTGAFSDEIMEATRRVGERAFRHAWEGGGHGGAMPTGRR